MTSVPLPAKQPARDVLTLVIADGTIEELTDVLAGVAGQSRAPGQVVVVDVSPEGTLNAEHTSPELATTTVIAAPGARNLGDAVRTALGALPQAQEYGWLWLLHDDSVPDRACLAELSRAVELAPSVVIAGTKQRRSDNPAMLIEVGTTTSRLGRRVNWAGENELDQGQHDHREDVLAVGTAGMLISQEFWHQVDGPDRALGPYRDGLDLCRRAHLAGHRVVVVPEAIVNHTQAGYRGLRGHRGDKRKRRRAIEGDLRRSYRPRRRALVHYQLAECAGPLVPIFIVGFLVMGVIRALWRLTGKQFAMAWAEIASPIRVILRPGEVRAARRRAKATRIMPRRSLKPLLASNSESWSIRRDRRLALRDTGRGGRVPNELELREFARLRRHRRYTLAGLTLALAALSALSMGQLLTTLPLTGGALRPIDGSWGEVWQAAISPWIYDGLGGAGPADPQLLVVAALATFTLGDVQLAINALIIAAPLLAGLGAWFAAGAATRSLTLRSWAVLAWVATPTLWLALGQGRLGALIAYLALPWFALALARALGVARRDVPPPSLRPGSRVLMSPYADPSLTAAAVAALLAAVIVAGSPLLAPVLLVLLIMVAPLVPGRRWRLAWSAASILAIMAPLWLAAIRRDIPWRTLLADPGYGLSHTPAAGWMQLLGWPVHPPSWPTDLPSAVVSAAYLAGGALIVVFAALALLRRGPRGRGIRLAWFTAAFALAAAVAAGHLIVGADESAYTSIWSGPAVAVVVAALLAAALVGIDRLPQADADQAPTEAEPSSEPVRRHRGLAATGAVLALLVPLVTVSALAWQLHGGDLGPLAARAHSSVPAIAAEAQDSADAGRTLLVWSGPQQSVSWRIVRGNGEQLTGTAAAARIHTTRDPIGGGAPTLAPLDAATQDVSAAVAAIGAGVDSGGVQRLQQAGVSFIVLPAAKNSAHDASPDALASALDSADGLTRVTENDSGIVWRVSPPNAPADDPARAARAHIVNADGSPVSVVSSGQHSISTDIPAGQSGRKLVLAERTSQHWHASLDGHRLNSTSLDWRQAFELPADGGHLTVVYSDPGMLAVRIGQLVLLFLLILLAIPAGRRSQDPRS